MSLSRNMFAIAMIPLGDNSVISPGAIKNDLLSTWPDLPSLGPFDNSNNILNFVVGETAHVFVSHMYAPIPWTDLEGPCATSVLFPDAEKVLRPHREHLLITIKFDDSRSPIEKSKLLTQITASILETCDAALGVYWCNAMLVVPPKLFREFAVKILPEGPPINIWVDFRFGTNKKGKMSGFTTGMRALGHKEIETNSSPETVIGLRERFEGLVYYLLENGPIINSGDTIGENQHEHIKVVYSRSAIGHEGEVMRLDYEPIKKRRWFRF